MNANIGGWSLASASGMSASTKRRFPLNRSISSETGFTAALTWNDCIGNHVTLLGSPVYCETAKCENTQ